MSGDDTTSIGLRAGAVDDPDRYELRRTVAAGSEGILYEARRLDDGDGVRVAVKMLHPGHHADFDRWVARWMEQAELLQHLAAPGLVRVRDAFVGPLPHPEGAQDPTSRSLYLVMDWVEGEPLWSWVEEHPELSAAALLLPLLPVGTALDLLHSGIATSGNVLVHGDVKPSNILVAPSGTVLVDLGAVRMFDAARQSGVSGTHGYVAPEVLAVGRWSAASDRYALGCVALALLCGKEPPARATEDQLRAILEASPRCQQTPEVIDHVMTMLATDPADRPTSCANWLAQVRGSSIVTTSREAELPPIAPGRSPDALPVTTVAATGPASPRRGRRAALAAAVLVLAAGATAAVVLRDGGDRPETFSSAPSSSTTTTLPDPRPAHCVRGTDGALTLRTAPGGEDTGVGIPEGSCDVRDLTMQAELSSAKGLAWRHVEWQRNEGWVATRWLEPVGGDAAAGTGAAGDASPASAGDADGRADEDDGGASVAIIPTHGDVAVPPTSTSTPSMGNPVLLSIGRGEERTEGGVTYGELRLTFDRPVRIRAPGDARQPRLVVHGGDGTCSSITGVGSDAVRGDGTDHLVVEAPVEPGATYVTVEAGYVTDLSGQLSNDRADCWVVSPRPLGHTG